MPNPANNLIVLLTDGVGNVIERWNEARDIAINNIAEEVYEELRKRS